VTAPRTSPNLRPLAWLLLVAFGWTTFVWINRLVNLGYDDRDMAFLVVHFVVAGISLAIGAALGWWGWKLLRSAPSP
jgi:hypothetical protein